MKKFTKTVKIFSGTDIAMCSPSHPTSVAMATKRVIDHIKESGESEFEYRCNTPEGIYLWEQYGHLKLGFNIKYHLNGKAVTYDAVMADLVDRAKSYIETIIKS